MWIKPIRRGGRGINLADETIDMEVEFVGGDSIVHYADIGDVGGGTIFPKAGPSAIGHHIFHNQQAVFMSFDIETACPSVDGFWKVKI